MKALTILLFSAAILSSCSSPDSEKLQDFAPGIYIREINHEHAIGMDTLTVKPLDNVPNAFSIIKSSGLNPKLDGKELSREYRTEEFVTELRPELKQLYAKGQDETFTLVPEKNVLMMGSTEYKKIKKE
ncbi:MAG: hypothetical protein E6Q36_07455 [Chryseobacterium sp.]|nr:MAG: hypothetical protein E6Q36_07455 [Chryseobacterium sp.]